MRSAICEETAVVHVVDMPQPMPAPGEILVRVRACGICGTDVLKVYNSAIAKPVQIGHEVVGTIAAVGAGVAAWQIGQRLALAHHVPCYVCHYCRHGNISMCATFKASNIHPGGFADYVIASAAHALQTALPLPDDLPDARAVFVEPLACCVRALHRAALQPGDSAVVVGVGAIGLMFLALLRHQHIATTALDLRDDRLELAHSWGAAQALNAAEADTDTLVREWSAGRGVDLVVLTVANAATIAQAQRLVRDGGSILIFGAKPGDRPAAIDLWDVYRREITLLSSYSPAPANLHTALKLLQTPGFAFELLATHLPLEQLSQGMVLSRSQQAFKVIVRP